MNSAEHFFNILFRSVKLRSGIPSLILNRDNIHSFVLFINLIYRYIIVNQQLLISSSGIFSNLTILMC